MTELIAVLKKVGVKGNNRKQDTVKQLLLHHIRRARHAFFLKIRNLQLENLLVNFLGALGGWCAIRHPWGNVFYIRSKFVISTNP